MEEVDIGDGDRPKPTFISAKLDPEYKQELVKLLKEYKDCFSWEYYEMPGLDRSIVEHQLPIKPGYRPHQRGSRRCNPKILPDIKAEITKLIEAKFIRQYRYAEWISNVVPVYKKNGNVGYNQIFMAEEDIHKTAFRCPGHVGLFEWIVMTFGLKNTGATY